MKGPFSTTNEAGTIWALKDVSLEMKQGEVVGVIGRNGAGKSTLLKVLSHITEPTEGRVEIRGRVGSLLEVGTGFHAELTGRENIYLNGAILGMKRAEIDRKFDEIVAFAEIEKFLDTPVKRYSSGMHVRLAFAVAAHLEPEVLVVDEVLAVGDAQFQKRCIAKMLQISSSGMTVLLVSHNISTIRELCPRTVLLDKGYLVADAETGAVVNEYISRIQTAEPSRTGDLPKSTISSNEDFEFLSCFIESSRGVPTTVVGIGEPFAVVLHYRLSRPVQDLVLAVGVSCAVGSNVATVFSDCAEVSPPGEPGRYRARVKWQGLILGKGFYSIGIGAAEKIGKLAYIPAAMQFVVEDISWGASLRLGSFTRNAGPVIAPMEWRIEAQRE
jgi:lipopolysaccharide transport system ATP-binding protein